MEWKYGDATIALNEASKTFVVTHSDGETGKSYDTYAQAMTAIDARQEREERANRVKISVAVISSRGRYDDGAKSIVRHTITGVHGGHGGYLSKPAIDKYGSDGLYLDHPAVLAILKRLREAEATVTAIENELKPFALSTSDYERRNLHLDTSDGIKAWADKKTAEADALLKVSS